MGTIELPLAEAADALGISPEAVRMRWRRGKLRGRRHRGRILIQVEQETGQRPVNDQGAAVVELLKAQVADLQKRLDASDQAQAEMRRLLLQSQAQLADMTKMMALPPPAAAVQEEPRRSFNPWAAFWPWSRL